MHAARCLGLLLAAVVLLALVLVVAFVFIGLFRMTEYYAAHCTTRTPRAKVSDIYPLLKTGDLLLFVASAHTPLTSALLQTFHSHAGLLLRSGELLYVAEASSGCELMPDPRGPGAPDVRLPRGAALSPLLTRLKYYTGVCYVARLSRPLCSAREALVKAAAERLLAESYPYPSTFQALLGLAGRATRSRHCFQHVAHLLDLARLTPLDRAAPLSEAGFAGVCREVCALPGRPLPDGYHYEPPVQLVYDLGTLQYGDPAPARGPASAPFPAPAPAPAREPASAPFPAPAPAPTGPPKNEDALPPAFKPCTTLAT